MFFLLVTIKKGEIAPTLAEGNVTCITCYVIARSTSRVTFLNDIRQFKRQRYNFFRICARESRKIVK